MSILKTLVCSLIIKIVGTTVHRLTFQLKNFYDDSLYYFDLDETVLLRHFRDAVYNVSSVHTQITQIATAAEQQTTATSEISSNMQGITEDVKQLNEIVESERSNSEVSTELLQELQQEINKLTV